MLTINDVIIYLLKNKREQEISDIITIPIFFVRENKKEIRFYSQYIFNKFNEKNLNSFQYAALAVHSDYWLEKIDPFHREGKWLKKEYEQWLILKSDLKDIESFFKYLGDKGMQYKLEWLCLKKAEEYKLFFDIKENLLYFNNGNLFDTSQFVGKVNQHAAFVIDVAGNVYCHEHKSGYFHHSSLNQSKPVLFAGFIKCTKGKVDGINNLSGHYKSTKDELEIAALRFRGYYSLNPQIQFLDKKYSAGYTIDKQQSSILSLFGVGNLLKYFGSYTINLHNIFYLDEKTGELEKIENLISTIDLILSSINAYFSNVLKTLKELNVNTSSEEDLKNIEDIFMRAKRAACILNFYGIDTKEKLIFTDYLLIQPLKAIIAKSSNEKSLGFFLKNILSSKESIFTLALLDKSQTKLQTLSNKEHITEKKFLKKEEFLNSKNILAICKQYFFNILEDYKTHKILCGKKLTDYRKMQIEILEKIIDSAQDIDSLVQKLDNKCNDTELPTIRFLASFTSDKVLLKALRTGIDFYKKIEIFLEPNVDLAQNMGSLDFNFIPFFNLKKESLIGKSSNAIVYQSIYLNKSVVVKEINQWKFNQEDSLEWIEELKFINKLNSPFIIQLFGICLETNKFSIVMEYLPKGSLCQFFKHEEFLPWPIRYRIALDIAQGIEHLHKHQLIHCNLKSSNILLYADYKVKICDFYTNKIKSKILDENAIFSKDILIWTAPEALKKNIYTTQSDMYSYSVILWSLATQSIPFENLNIMQIFDKLNKEEREIIPDKIPITFNQLIQDCWQQEPIKRLSAVQVAEKLKSEIEQKNVLNYSEEKPFLFWSNPPNSSLSSSLFSDLEYSKNEFAKATNQN